MKANIWNKKIPTLLGILFLVIGIGVTSVLVNRGTTFLTRASGDAQPKNVTISNLTSSSATISFTTDPNIIATILYEKTPNEVETLTDIRDKQAGPTKRNTHFFTLTNLTPTTTYSFKITSGGSTYDQDPNLPFEITTPTEKNTREVKEYTISGKVFSPDGQVGKDTIIYFSSDKTAVVSTITGLDGGFSLDMKQVRTKDIQDVATLTDTDVFLLFGTNGPLQTQATFRLDQASPFPNLVLSNTYDFSSQLALSRTETSVPVQGFPSGGEDTSTEIVKITSPRPSQKLSDTKPLFQGTARVNENVDITIDTDEPISARVLTNKQGQWTYRSASILPVGNYTISIKARDDDKILKTVTTSFSISK